MVSDSMVRRYEPDGSDGLPGTEATFQPVLVLVRGGADQGRRIAEGRYVFEKMITYANQGAVRRRSARPARRSANLPQELIHLALSAPPATSDRALSESCQPP